MSLVPNWNRGDPLTAAKLNEGVDAVNALAAMHATPIGVAIFVEVIDVLADCLKVRPFGVNATSEAFDFYAAKPWDLRSAPFNGQTRPDQDGTALTFTYASTVADQQRLVTRTNKYAQLVRPAYVKRRTVSGTVYHGDVLLVRRQVMEEINVTVSIDAADVPVEWIDCNIAGRRWEPNNGFAVKMYQTGGSAGDKTNPCTFTYTVKDLDGNTLGTVMTPEKNREAAGKRVAPTDGDYGWAFLDTDGELVLYDPNEVWSVEAC